MKLLLLLVVVVATVALAEPQKRGSVSSASSSSSSRRGGLTGGLQKRDGDWWSGEDFWPMMSWGNRGYYGRGYDNYNTGFRSSVGHGNYGGQYGGRSRPYSGASWYNNYGSFPWYAMWGDDNNWSGEWFSDRLGLAAPTGTGRSVASGRSAGRTAGRSGGRSAGRPRF